MNTSDETMQIARTILEQIKVVDRAALLAWGASNFMALPQTEKFEGGIEFKVNGLTHQGWVRVELTYADDYTVTFINKAREVVLDYERVYADMLVHIIDFIEGN